MLEVSSLKIVYSIIYFHFKFYGCHGDEVFCISLYIVSRCHGMDDIVKSLYIFFSLSEIEYSATIDRGGMIHGWLFITLPHRLWCRVTLFTADVECFVLLFLLIKIQLILKKLSPKAWVWWMPFYRVTERKYTILDFSTDFLWFNPLFSNPPNNVNFTFTSSIEKKLFQIWFTKNVLRLSIV